MAYNPTASWAGPGPDASWAGPGPDSFAARRKALLQWLAGRGVTQAGFGGLRGRSQSAVGRIGGMGGTAPASGLNYNPFLAQVFGRGENFIGASGGIPQGISQAAL